MSKRLVIAGAGGFGRGVRGWVQGSPTFLRSWEISEVVYIDDQEPARDPGARIVSAITDYRPDDDDLVLCAVAAPEIRREICRALSARGAKFATFVDDRAVLCTGVRVGEGSIVCPGSVLGADAEVMSHVHINFNCSIGHDTRLGAFSTLSPSVNIMGEVEVGESSFFGGSSVVLPRLRVGESAVIGASACVVRDVSVGAVVRGVPAI